MIHSYQVGNNTINLTEFTEKLARQLPQLSSFTC